MSRSTSPDDFVETLLQLLYEHASVQLAHAQQPTAFLQIET